MLANLQNSLPNVLYAATAFAYAAGLFILLTAITRLARLGRGDPGITTGSVLILFAISVCLVYIPSFIHMVGDTLIRPQDYKAGASAFAYTLDHGTPPMQNALGVIFSSLV